MPDDPLVPRSVAAMRQAFDAAFAEPRREGSRSTQRVMLVRIGSTPYAVRLEECSAIVPLPSITTLPSVVYAFCGVAHVRGALVPVYDLARLLQLDTPADASRWLLVTAGDDRVGFIVDALEGHGTAAEQAQEAGDPTPVVQVDDTDYRLLALPRIVAGIREQAGLET